MSEGMGERGFDARLLRAMSEAGVDERQREILSSRVGLCGTRQETLREIGERLGISRERVRQVEAQAMAMVARALRART